MKASQRGLLAQEPPAAGEPAQQVERQREHLERDEEGQQVVGRREEQHATDREHEQRVDLGVLQTAVDASRSASVPGRAAAWPANAETRPRAGARRRAGRRPARRRRMPQKKTVGPSITIVPSTSTEPQATPSPGRRGRWPPDRARERDQQAGRREHRLDPEAQRTRDERLHEDPDARDSEDHEQRPELAVLDGGLHEVHQ